MNIKIIVIGASNPTIFSLIDDINQDTNELHFDLQGVVDNDYKNIGNTFFDVDILGGFDQVLRYSVDDVKLINSIAGSMSVRKSTTNFFLEKGYKFVSLVHPTVQVKNSTIGSGTIIYQDAMLHPYVSIGEHCVISSMAGIAHESQVSDFCFIGPATYVCGKVYIGEKTYLGVGSKILPRVRIGKDCTIGAMSLVTKDVDDNRRVIGVPAREK